LRSRSLIHSTTLSSALQFLFIGIKGCLRWASSQFLTIL
jgi:hypothetical protein